MQSGGPKPNACFIVSHCKDAKRWRVGSWLPLSQPCRDYEKQCIIRDPTYLKSHFTSQKGLSYFCRLRLHYPKGKFFFIAPYPSVRQYNYKSTLSVQQEFCPLWVRNLWPVSGCNLRPSQISHTIASRMICFYCFVEFDHVWSVSCEKRNTLQYMKALRQDVVWSPKVCAVAAGHAPLWKQNSGFTLMFLIFLLGTSGEPYWTFLVDQLRPHIM